jgi:hypothetical protein
MVWFCFSVVLDLTVPRFTEIVRCYVPECCCCLYLFVEILAGNFNLW